MNAFFLAAGFGTRMKEYTRWTPKPLLRIQGVGLLDYSLFLAKKWGVSQAIVNAHYLGDQIQSHLEKFKGFPVYISREEEILGTGGGIYTGLENYPEFKKDWFVLVNPDTLLFPSANDFTLQATEILTQNKSLSHLYLMKLPEDKSYTPLYWKEGRVSFAPTEGSVACYYIGLSLIHPQAFEKLDSQPHQNFSMGEVWKELDREGLLTGEFFSGRAIDVGEKELYESLDQDKSLFSDPSIVENIGKMFGIQ